MQSSRIAMRSLSGSTRRFTASSMVRGFRQARNLHVQAPAAMYMRSDRLRYSLLWFISCLVSY